MNGHCQPWTTVSNAPRPMLYMFGVVIKHLGNASEGDVSGVRRLASALRG